MLKNEWIKSWKKLELVILSRKRYFPTCRVQCDNIWDNFLWNCWFQPHFVWGGGNSPSQNLRVGSKTKIYICNFKQISKIFKKKIFLEKNYFVSKCYFFSLNKNTPSWKFHVLRGKLSNPSPQTPDPACRHVRFDLKAKNENSKRKCLLV